ncbi:hypothetical protein CS8_002200 [Cupriavidus sp. 8B]
MVIGRYIGWAVNVEAVRYGLLNMWSSKVDYARRLGVEGVTDADIPAVMVRTLIVDRGEGNAAKVRDDLRKLGVELHVLPRGRADQKGLVEVQHSSDHSRVDHSLPGTTYGRKRDRGEKHPGENALLNIEEFSRMMLRADIRHNTTVPVPHLLTAEMRQDGVRPIRSEIWAWARRKGYVGYISCHRDVVVDALMDKTTAVVRENGIFLIAPVDEGRNREVVLTQFRYHGAYAADKKWLERARMNGIFRIDIKFNPYDLRRIFYLDPYSGYHELELQSQDSSPVWGVASLRDCVEDKLRISAEAGVENQRDIEMAAALDFDREVEIAAARRQYHAEAKLSPKGRVHANRMREDRRTETDILGPTGLPLGRFATVSAAEPMGHDDQSIEQDGPRDGALRDWLKGGADE